LLSFYADLVTTALVRRPSSRLSEGIVTHITRSAVDLRLAEQQWEAYVEALRSVGWEIHEVPPLESAPDCVFIEDTVVVYRDLAVITRPGDDRRKPEVAAVEPAVRELGYRVERIVAPGTLDGGDVLKIGDTVYVGLGGRTNQAGIDQLTALIAPLGGRVVRVPVNKVLHLKSAVTALPDGTVIGWDAAVDNPSIFPTYLSMPEESGAHVVVLDDRRVLMAADAPRSAEMLRARGYEVLCVDISEYEKLEGCVTCLSVRLRS
jgi:dimethylargininase